MGGTALVERIRGPESGRDEYVSRKGAAARKKAERSICGRASQPDLPAFALSSPLLPSPCYTSFLILVRLLSVRILESYVIQHGQQRTRIKARDAKAARCTIRQQWKAIASQTVAAAW